MIKVYHNPLCDETFRSYYLPNRIPSLPDCVLVATIDTDDTSDLQILMTCEPKDLINNKKYDYINFIGENLRATKFGDIYEHEGKFYVMSPLQCKELKDFVDDVKRQMLLEKLVENCPDRVFSEISDGGRTILNWFDFAEAVHHRNCKWTDYVDLGLTSLIHEAANEPNAIEFYNRIRKEFEEKIAVYQTAMVQMGFLVSMFKCMGDVQQNVQKEEK